MNKCLQVTAFLSLKHLHIFRQYQIKKMDSSDDELENSKASSIIDLIMNGTRSFLKTLLMCEDPSEATAEAAIESGMFLFTYLE